MNLRPAVVAAALALAFAPRLALANRHRGGSVPEAAPECVRWEADATDAGTDAGESDAATDAGESDAGTDAGESGAGDHAGEHCVETNAPRGCGSAGGGSAAGLLFAGLFLRRRR